MNKHELSNLLYGKKIIIYGAGKIGKTILQTLHFFNYHVEFFWDKNSDIIKDKNATPIIRPDFNVIPLELRKNYTVITTIFSKTINKNIANNLQDAGYNVVYDIKNIDAIIYLECSERLKNKTFKFNMTQCHNCPVPKDNYSCDIFYNYIAHNLAKGVCLSATKKEKIIIPKLGLSVSNKCNLRCKNCNHLRYLYKKGDAIEFTPEELIRDLKRILNVIDLVSQITIVGGEAFLHPQLYEIIEMILKLPKIGIIQIITNGTVLPKDSGLFELLSDDRIIVEISGYEDRISSALQKKLKKFISELKKLNVNYNYIKTLQWFDFGDFKNRDYSDEQHKDIYNNCCFISNDIFNGKLYKCSRSAFATLLEKIPKYKDDYIDIRNGSLPELNTNLIKFLNNNVPKVCLHCNGTSVLIPVAGSQSIGE